MTYSLETWIMTSLRPSYHFIFYCQRAIKCWHTLGNFSCYCNICPNKLSNPSCWTALLKLYLRLSKSSGSISNLYAAWSHYVRLECFVHTFYLQGCHFRVNYAQTSIKLETNCNFKFIWAINFFWRLGICHFLWFTLVTIRSYL